MCDRIHIDNVQNKNGDTFLEFLHESKCYVANGRIGDTDMWISVTSKGRSVVDYVFVPNQVLEHIESFNIHIPRELCNTIGYKPDGAESYVTQ